MASRIVLHYFPGNSVLHGWDPRCKFIGLLMVTATLIRPKVEWFIIDSVLFIGLLVISRLPIRMLLRELWNWMIFLLVLFLFQIFLTPGTPFAGFSWLPISREGLHSGGMTFIRLALLLCFAVLFTSVTRPRELQDALVWLLKPLPFVPKRRIGLMVSLTLRFFAVILEESDEVRLAHKARLGDRRHNPLRKAKFLGLPILRRSLSRAEEVTFALAARGYRDDIPVRLSKLTLTHLIPLFLLFGFLLAVGWVLHRPSL